MSLEAAILATAMSPPQYWEKYPNLISQESGGMTWNTTYQTFLQINAPGYLRNVWTGASVSAPKLRITLDGVVTEIIDSYSSSSIPIGIIQEDFLTFYNTSFNIRIPGVSSVVGLGTGNSLIPASEIGSSYTTSSPMAIMIIPQPLVFKSSLKIEYAMNSGSSTGGTLGVQGGHA